MNLVIGVLTYRRPQMLAAALESLRRLSVPEGVCVTAIVVDNNPDASALAQVLEVARNFPFPLQAVHEPQRGIASGRNRLVETALVNGADAIVFFDDDEMVRPDWLKCLVEVFDRYRADVVAGPVNPVLPPDAPAWAAVLFRTKSKETGTPLRMVATSNVLFSAKLVRDWGLRFDTRLDLCGSEDVMFFGQALAQGAQMVWAAEAWVDEVVHSERLTRRAIFLRYFGGASSHTRAFYLRHGLWPTLARYLPRSLEKLAGAALTLPMMTFGSPTATGRFLGHAGTGLGIIAGISGLVYDRYQTTQGR